MAKAAVKPLTKSQLLASIAETTELTKKEVDAVLEALTAEVSNALSKKGPGQFTLPGLLKIVKVRKKAVKAQKGVKNPFTGEISDRPAKPACDVVKVRPLKGLKEMV